MTPQESPEEDDRSRTRERPTGTLRGLLARIARNTEPKPRKRPDEQSGRTEVRGD